MREITQGETLPGSQASDVEDAGGAVENEIRDGILNFSGPDDKRHPHNWSLASRVSATFMLAMLNLAVTVSSSIFGSAQKKVADQFDVGEEVAVLGTSLFLVVGACSIHPFSRSLHRRKRGLASSDRKFLLSRAT